MDFTDLDVFPIFRSCRDQSRLFRLGHQEERNNPFATTIELY